MQTIRQSIVPDDEVRSLVKELLTVNDRITEAQATLDKAQMAYDTYNGADEAKDHLKMIEGEIAFEISLETNGDGKKKFPNAEARAAELKKRCPNNEEWVAAFDALRSAERRKNELKMETLKCGNSVRQVTGRKYALSSLAEIVAGLSREDLTVAKMEALSRMASLIEQAIKDLN